MYLLGNALITILVNLVTVHTCPGGGGGGGVGCVGKFIQIPISSVFTLIPLITHAIMPIGIFVHTCPNICSLQYDSPYNSYCLLVYLLIQVQTSSVFTSSVSLTTHNSCWYICLYKPSEEALLDASFSVHSACLDNPSDQCHCAVRYSAREGHCGSAP